MSDPDQNTNVSSNGDKAGKWDIGRKKGTGGEGVCLFAGWSQNLRTLAGGDGY